jgi:ribosomal protein S18 acetylase RimI-like enzyme
MFFVKNRIVVLIMEIIKIENNKKMFLDLLLLGDEEENMIDRYLEDSEMFALFDQDLKSICAVKQLSKTEFEIKNIATYEKYQRQGYGYSLIKFVLNHYKDKCVTMYVGTGDLPSIIDFYKKFGFKLSHKVKNFFLDNYDHPIYENNTQLIDMVYLKKDLNK